MLYCSFRVRGKKGQEEAAAATAVATTTADPADGSSATVGPLTGDETKAAAASADPDTSASAPDGEPPSTVAAAGAEQPLTFGAALDESATVGSLVTTNSIFCLMM